MYKLNVIIIITAIKLVLCSKHSIIGDYSQLNPKDCGLSRTTSPVNNCFKYHKNMAPEMKGGRSATLGEAPWANLMGTILKIRDKQEIKKTLSQCTGSFIANNWVITAAHCVNFDTNNEKLDIIEMKTYVFSGYKTGFLLTNKSLAEYAVLKAYIHPHYKIMNELNVGENDIALLKLDSPINKTTENGQILENSICLPKPNYKVHSDNLVMAAGHGTHGYPYNETGYDTRPLQLGFRKVVADPSKLFAVSNVIVPPTTITTLSVGGQAMLCQGDSGGPIWTYDNGKAVLLGVLSIGDTEGDHCNSESGWTVYTSISDYIPWIKEVTKLN